MNIKKTLLAVLALFAFVAAPVLAKENEPTDDSRARASAGLNADLKATFPVGGIRTNTNADAKFQLGGTMEARAKERAIMEIDRRIKALTAMSARVDDRKRVDDDVKADISANADAQIKALNELKAKIQAENDASVIKSDVASITGSYRIFALIIPKGAIVAMADRIENTADIMAEFGAKLDARIDEADDAGKDVTAMEKLYADYTAKLADAKVQADAAVDITADLEPDEKDQAAFEANKKALVEARTKLQAAHKDLQDARKDAADIVKAFKDLGINASIRTEVKTEKN